MEQYVCAFRGRRDCYQVPVALAESGLLDEFITDAYALPVLRRAAIVAPVRWREKILLRYEPAIPDDRVRCLWGTTAIEHLRHGLGLSPSVTFAKLDARFSRAAARRAIRCRGHLFLYSPYAWEAFVANYPHTPHRVMFQYHPHPEVEHRILREDRRLYPFVNESFQEDTGQRLSQSLKLRTCDPWRYADLIFCASTFTKRSLIEVGAAESFCCTVPYGVNVPEQADEAHLLEAFRVLFVGSGTQRKGLHHLLLAWRNAALPESSSLTVVCRTIDSGIERLLAATPRVELVRGLPETALNRWFASSTLFAMPSLVEGFGQVFLEALAHGCPVLGTPNTCLPDLGGEADGIYMVTPGNIEELIGKMELLAQQLPGDADIRTRAQSCAARFSWRQFRINLISALKVRM